MSASVGVVERAVAGTDADELMRAADITLHWAKAAGKGAVGQFDADRNEREVARYALSRGDAGARCDRDEFSFVYQPLVVARDRTAGRGGGARAVAPSASWGCCGRTSSSGSPRRAG